MPYSTRLIHDSAAIRVPANLRERVARAFEHRDMRRACEAFVARPAPVSGSAGSRLLSVAEAFIELQTDRHLADYDAVNPFSRTQAFKLLGSAEQAFLDLDAVRGDPLAEEFLLDLLMQSVRKR